MSITIHHGANGSYKTSGVVQDYYLPAALAGRVVVTNIRGISRERTFELFPDTPEKHDVIYVDTDTSEGRQKLSTWWHWCPLGALLLFDEAGVNFPKRWRESDLQTLNYPPIIDGDHQISGMDAAAAAGRPYDWIEAWEKHRHYNWDIVLSAPNIKSLRDDIRNTTEGAYKHKNRALLGPLFKGSYKEGYHDATTNGVSQSDFFVIKNKRIKPAVFGLYDSTKTGKAQDTLNGFNLFTHPKVLLLLAVAFLPIGWAFYNGLPSIFSEAPPAAVQTPNPAPKAAPDPVQVATFNDLESRFQTLNGVPDSGLLDGKNSLDHPLKGFSAKISGYAYQPSTDHYFYQFQVNSDQGSRYYTVEDLQRFGYAVKAESECSLKIIYNGARYSLGCFTVTL
jgi:zona occludens toxin